MAIFIVYFDNQRMFVDGKIELNWIGINFSNKFEIRDPDSYNTVVIVNQIFTGERC